MKKLFYILCFLMFTLSGVTFTAESGGESISSRLAIPDIVGAFICLFVSLIILYKKRIIIPKQYKIYLYFLVSLLISCIFSSLKDRALFEYLIHLFIFAVSLCLYNYYVFYNNKIKINYLLLIILWSGATIATIGLLHFFLFPSWFPTVEGGLSGTFRNTGQAGAYFSVLLAIIIPAYLSKSIKRNTINSFLIIIIILALLFTFKRSSIIAFIIGISLFITINLFSTNKNFKTSIFLISAVLVCLIIAWSFFLWGLDNIQGMQWRVNHKFNSGSANQFSNFFSDNATAAFSAIMDRPILGVGLDNIRGVYSEEYEIHSGYLSIASSSGLIGMLFYILFMATFLYKIWKNSHQPNNEASVFLRYFIPFFIGLSVSWIYTYPIRKREFWLLIFIISVIINFTKSNRKLSKI